MLTMDIIEKARNNDTQAINQVLSEFDKTISGMVYEIANRYGITSSVQRDDLAQEARIALWKALYRFTGDSVSHFKSFMHKTMKHAMQDARLTERLNGVTGVDRHAWNEFVKNLRETDFDYDEAERMTRETYRISATRARAARLAVEGQVSIDALVSFEDNDDKAVSGTLADDTGQPELIYLAEYEPDGEDTREDRIARVRAIINRMRGNRRAVLCARWGIDSPCLGSGAEADNELAAVLGVTPANVRSTRTQAHKSFAKSYSALTGLEPCMCERCSAERRAEGISL